MLYPSWLTGRAPLAKVAALNSQIVALHRYFGPRRLARDARASPIEGGETNTLDIVIMTVRGANVLDRIGIDSSEYTVEYFDGPPLMLAFEAQRIMRERAGGYDFYGYMEDDLSITDPAFFEKLGWFASQFGPEAMLVPARYEMSHTGTLAKMTIEPRLSGDIVKGLRRSGLPATLSGRWNGREQTFHLPNNPSPKRSSGTGWRSPRSMIATRAGSIRWSVPRPTCQAACSACIGPASPIRGFSRSSTSARFTPRCRRSRARPSASRRCWRWPRTR